MGEWFNKHVAEVQEESSDATFGADARPDIPLSQDPTFRTKTLSSKPYLKYGMMHVPEVGVLQDLLIEKMAGPKAADLQARLAASPSDRNDYGNRTVAAVKEYQASAQGMADGLKPDGEAGVYTWNSLAGTPISPGSAPPGSNVPPVVVPPKVVTPPGGGTPKVVTPPKVIKPGQPGHPVQASMVPSWAWWLAGGAGILWGGSKLFGKKHHHG